MKIHFETFLYDPTLLIVFFWHFCNIIFNSGYFNFFSSFKQLQTQKHIGIFWSLPLNSTQISSYEHPICKFWPNFQMRIFILQSYAKIIYVFMTWQNFKSYMLCTPYFFDNEYIILCCQFAYIRKYKVVRILWYYSHDSNKIYDSI